MLFRSLKNIPGHAFDGEILVHTADALIVGLEKNPIIGVVGDCAARGQRGQARTSPPAQQLVDGVMMNQCAAPAALCVKTLGEHRNHGKKIGPREIAIWPSAA